MVGIAMIATASALLAVAANAEIVEVIAPPSERVSYADLDLNSAAGKALLKRRILDAVSHVCPRPSHISAELTMISHECRGTALTGAWRQMDQAIARSRGGPAFAAALVITPGR